MSVAKSALRAVLPRTPGPHRILSGPLRGIWIVTSWHDYPGALTGRTERPLIEWFQQHVRPGQTWLDIGGHYGYTAFALSMLAGEAGRVFTFEPVCASAGCIDQGRLLNRMRQLTVLTYGLGAPETIETTRLPLTRGMADSTLVAGGDVMVATIVVARFDWLWPRINGGDDRIDGIKIDVQGMEIEVLRGMMHTLRQHRPLLVVEVHGGVDRGVLLDLLAEAGYAPAPQSVDAPSAANGEMQDDCSYAFVPSAR
jgi:FkbM family methyltransferase